MDPSPIEVTVFLQEDEVLHEDNKKARLTYEAGLKKSYYKAFIQTCRSNVTPRGIIDSPLETIHNAQSNSIPP